MRAKSKPATADADLVSAVCGWQLQDLKIAYRTGASIAVRTMAGAHHHANCNGYSLEVLKRRGDDVLAFAICKAPGSGSAECWVHVQEEDYANQFYAFLRTHFDFPQNTRFPRTIQIDHLFSRYMCELEGMNYVRLAPITQRGNSHSGSREYQFVNNAEHAAPYDPENGFGLTEEDRYCTKQPPTDEHDLSFRPLWGPSLVKLLPVFHAPPTGGMPAVVVMEVIRALHQQGLFSDDDLNEPFGPHLAAYRLYAAGIPNHEGTARVHALARDGEGNILTHDHTLAEWLSAKDLSEISAP